MVVVLQDDDDDDERKKMGLVEHGSQRKWSRTAVDDR